MASGRNFVFYAKEQVWLVICVGNAIYGFIKDVEWGRTKTKKSKDYCKADLKQHILFFITIFSAEPSSGLQMLLNLWGRKCLKGLDLKNVEI